MSSKYFKELRVYKLSEKLADKIWQIVNGWDMFAKNTMGTQMIRSADSIGANIAEVAIKIINALSEWQEAL